MIATKAVKVNLLPDAVRREAFAGASSFRGEFYGTRTTSTEDDSPAAIVQAATVVARVGGPPEPHSGLR